MDIMSKNNTYLLNTTGSNKAGNDSQTYESFDYTEYDDLIAFHVSLYKVAVPILFGLIMFVGVVGNILVIYAIISKTKMRTTVNVLLINLACCDLIFLTSCLPFVTYHYVADNWAIGDIMCKLTQFVMYATVYITIYTLVVISIVRYMMIVCPHRCIALKNKKNVIILILMIWIIQLIISIPITLVYKVKVYTPVDGSPPYYYCAMKGVNTGQRIFLSFFFLGYILPLCLIATFYIMLLQHLRISRKTSSLRQYASNRSATSRSQRRTSMASRILIVVVAVFGICWLPLHVHLLMVYFDGTQQDSYAYEVFRVLCHCLAYANACVNPIIYNCVSTEFRKCFSRIGKSCVSCLKKDTPRHTSTPSGQMDTFDREENATFNRT